MKFSDFEVPTMNPEFISIEGRRMSVAENSCREGKVSSLHNTKSFLFWFFLAFLPFFVFSFLFLGWVFEFFITFFQRFFSPKHKSLLTKICFFFLAASQNITFSVIIIPDR